MAQKFLPSGGFTANSFGLVKKVKMATVESIVEDKSDNREPEKPVDREKVKYIFRMLTVESWSL